MKSIGPWPTIMSFRPEKEQIEFECAGAAVAMASTCSCVRGPVPGGPLTSPAKAAPAVRLKKTAAQIPAANFLRIDLPPHLAALVAAFERSPRKILRAPPREVKRVGVDLSQRAFAPPRRAKTSAAPPEELVERNRRSRPPPQRSPVRTRPHPNVPARTRQTNRRHAASPTAATAPAAPTHEHSDPAFTAPTCDLKTTRGKIGHG
jgi:hypothetical protein